MTPVWKAVLPAIAGLIGSLLVPQPAGAAPFCIAQQGMTPQCMYYDARDCEREAKRQNMYCSANAKELKVRTGTGQYCLVTSVGTSLCVYPDRTTCSNDATRQHGICTDAIKIAPARTPDPYSAVNGQ